MTIESPELLSIRDAIAQASSCREPLRLTGGDTKAFYGMPPTGTALSLRPLQGIVSYEPTELVVTALAGTRLDELQAALAEKGQILAFEPPSFGAESTIGGVVAAGLSGPRRATAGSVRDFVLGARMIDAHGQWLSFGGQVMKNVAGYDIARLLTGSLGMLGVIAEVSLKVLPKPVAERSVVLGAAEADAIEHLNRWAGQPIPLSASCWLDEELSLRFSGTGSAVEHMVRQFADQHGATELDDADLLWGDLRDQRLGFFEHDDNATPLWRLSVPSAAGRIDLPGRQLIEWGGALRWWRTDAPAQTVRAAAHAVGGTACLFRGGNKLDGVFEPLAAPVEKIHRKLKEQFDPLGLFNPGRMYPGL